MGMRGSIWADCCTKRETRALPRSTTAGRSSSIPTAWSRSSTSAWRSKTCACPTRRSLPTAPRSRLTRAARMLTTTSRSSTRRAVKGRRRCATCARTASWCRREGARRNERVQLRGLARKLLSGRPSLEEDARVLRDAGAALCIAGSEDLATPAVQTAGFGYLSLRRLDYDSAALTKWADFVRTFSGEVFVYFKHEDEARGPAFAKEFLELM